MSSPTTAAALAACLALLAAEGTGCAGASPAGTGAAVSPAAPERLDAASAQATVARLAAALEGGRFEEARALLSARWRERYTPARLATDWRGAGAVAREAARRARSAGPGAVHLAGDGARVDVGEGRSAVLVAEAGVWRVDALE